MSPIEINNSVEKFLESAEYKINKLEENLASVVFDKIVNSFTEMSHENLELCTNLINNECSRDSNVIAKWDFMATLEKIKLKTV